MRLQRMRLGRDGLPTLGTMMSRDGTFHCVTLERSTNGDHPCIPFGTYIVDRAIHHPGTPGEYLCPELRDVPGRSHIQIHVANRVAELLGCIATGNHVADDELAVEESKAAFDRMMAHIGGNWPFTLEVVDP